MAAGEDVDAAIALSDPASDQVSRMRAEGISSSSAGSTCAGCSEAVSATSRMRAEGISSAGSACAGRSEVVPAPAAEGTADMQKNTSHGAHSANAPFHAPINNDQPPAAVGTSLGEDAATVREPSHMQMPLAASPNHVAEPLPERTRIGADPVERSAARLLARTFRANNLTTLQCF
eukprot:3832268-Amphidinium_carterae.1